MKISESFVATLRDYLLFSDFDGTIVDTKTFKISSNLSQILSRKNLPISFIVTTSRGWDGLKPYTEALSLSIPQILENGAQIFDPQSETSVFRKGLSRKSLKAISDIADQYGLKVSFSSETISTNDNKLLSKLDYVGRVSLLVTNGHYKQILSDLESLDDVHFVQGTDTNDSRKDFSIIDITAKEVDKALGVKNWIELLQPNPRRVYVFGNSENDLPLFHLHLEQCEIIKVAISDGHSELKKLADRLIPPPEKDGLATFLAEEFFQ